MNRSGDGGAVEAGTLGLKGARATVHLFGFSRLAERTIDFADGIADFGLDLRLLSQFGGDAFDSLLQYVSQQLSIAAHRHGRPDALEHFLEERRHLLAAAGLKIGTLERLLLDQKHPG